MIAIGVKCACGWGPQDVVPLEDATMFLKNLLFIVGRHYATCPSVQRIPMIKSTMSAQEEAAWTETLMPAQIQNGQCTACNHYHELIGGIRRKRQCGFCKCNQLQERMVKGSA